MSIAVEVRFATALLASPDAWQESIRANNFAVEMDRDFDPVAHSGFLSASYKGQSAGFEYLREQEGDGQSCVSLRWGGSPREAVSALIAAACLCHITSGTIADTETGETIQAHAAIGWARQQEADFQQLLAEENKQTVKGTRPKPKPWWQLW